MYLGGSQPEVLVWLHRFPSISVCWTRFLQELQHLSWRLPSALTTHWLRPRVLVLSTSPGLQSKHTFPVGAFQPVCGSPPSLTRPGASMRGPGSGQDTVSGPPEIRMCWSREAGAKTPGRPCFPGALEGQKCPADSSALSASPFCLPTLTPRPPFPFQKRAFTICWAVK